MLHQFGFGDFADGLAGHDAIAGFDQRCELPFFRRVERLHFFAAPNPRAAVNLNARQRSLDAVINVADQSRPQPHGQRRAGAADGRARLEQGRVLVNLDGRVVADQPHDFADQAQFADLDHLVHLRAGHAAGRHGGPADARDH